MINIELKVVDNPLQQKINKIKLYRLSSMIKIDIEEYIHEYFRYNIQLNFKIFQENLSKILNKYNIDYRFEYDYGKNFDNVKVFMGKNFMLDMKFIPESEYHI